LNQDRLIELIATEPGAVDRRNFPLTVGLPFRRGLLPAGDPVTIVDGTGTPQAVQTRVMETHVDGSARWMLLDYQADMPALGASKHLLVLGRDGPEPASGRRIEIKRRGRRLTVANGILELKIDGARCRPLERISKDGEILSTGGIEFRIVSEAEESFLASNDRRSRFEIEEQGPMRTLMRWEGSHVGGHGTKHFDFIVRLTVYAGNPFVRLDHTLRRMSSGPQPLSVPRRRCVWNTSSRKSTTTRWAGLM